MLRRITVSFVVALALSAAPPCLAGGVERPTDLFIGTAGDHGQVDPAACVPYGMVRPCPDTDPRSHSGYDYDVTRISGFSVNRISGVGCKGNGGNLSIRPAGADDILEIDKASESASPGVYRVSLKGGVRCELTATHNVAVERFTYPAGTDMKMTFDAGASFMKAESYSYKILSGTEITGRVSSPTTCNRGLYSFSFSLLSDRPFRVVSKGPRRAELDFGKSDGTPVEIRIALSPIDEATASQQNRLCASLTFGDIEKQAAAKWDAVLGSVDIKGGTPVQRTLFYTSLYRVFLSPGNVTSHDGRYRATDGQVTQADGFTYYGSWSMWDSYRTKFPLIALLDPAAMRDFAVSLSRLYRHGKEPWATMHESMPTVRTEHSSVVMLDAFRKGITDIELGEAYPYIIEDIKRLPLDRPDLRLETSIDIWAAAGIASALGKKGEAAEMEGRAAKLFRETWSEQFASPDSTYALMKDNGLYQGSKWQYRWAAPQYLDAMSQLSGGEKTLEDQLTLFFDKNLNNQGNEPGIHAPYIFNRMGEPAKTQRIVTRMLTGEVTSLYGGNGEYPSPVVRPIFMATPEGFLPEMDEDDGTMCAWYVFSAMGLFPLVVGEAVYEISSPVFDTVTLNLQNGKKFTVKATGRRSADDTIKSALLDGSPLKDMSIRHDQIVKGGTLELIYR